EVAGEIELVEPAAQPRLPGRAACQHAAAAQAQEALGGGALTAAEEGAHRLAERRVFGEREKHAAQVLGVEAVVAERLLLESRALHVAASERVQTAADQIGVTA